MLRIGTIAKLSGLGIETIRFYEREGLIGKPQRTPSGFRQYPETMVQQLRFIQHAKQLGFSLKEIGELIALKNNQENNCQCVKQTALCKLNDIQIKIDALERMKQSLLPLVQQCKAHQPIADCPILNNITS